MVADQPLEESLSRGACCWHVSGHRRNCIDEFFCIIRERILPLPLSKVFLGLPCNVHCYRNMVALNLKQSDS